MRSSCWPLHWAKKAVIQYLCIDLCAELAGEGTSVDLKAKRPREWCGLFPDPAYVSCLVILDEKENHLVAPYFEQVSNVSSNGVSSSIEVEQPK